MKTIRLSATQTCLECQDHFHFFTNAPKPKGHKKAELIVTPCRLCLSKQVEISPYGSNDSWDQWRKDLQFWKVVMIESGDLENFLNRKNLDNPKPLERTFHFEGIEGEFSINWDKIAIYLGIGSNSSREEILAELSKR